MKLNYIQVRVLEAPGLAGPDDEDIVEYCKDRETAVAACEALERKRS